MPSLFWDALLHCGQLLSNAAKFALCFYARKYWWDYLLGGHDVSVWRSPSRFVEHHMLLSSKDTNWRFFSIVLHVASQSRTQPPGFVSDSAQRRMKLGMLPLHKKL